MARQMSCRRPRLHRSQRSAEVVRVRDETEEGGGDACAVEAERVRLLEASATTTRAATTTAVTTTRAWLLEASATTTAV